VQRDCPRLNKISASEISISCHTFLNLNGRSTVDGVLISHCALHRFDTSRKNNSNDPHQHTKDFRSPFAHKKFERGIPVHTIQCACSLGRFCFREIIGTSESCRRRRRRRRRPHQARFEIERTFQTLRPLFGVPENQKKASRKNLKANGCC
jgi:hypothetical protein